LEPIRYVVCMLSHCALSNLFVYRCFHNFIHEHASDDVDFANFNRDPKYVPTSVPERYKYDVSQHASDGSTLESSFMTMDTFHNNMFVF
jgi:hypothetical protein